MYQCIAHHIEFGLIDRLEECRLMYLDRMFEKLRNSYYRMQMILKDMKEYMLH